VEVFLLAQTVSWFMPNTEQIRDHRSKILEATASLDEAWNESDYSAVEHYERVIAVEQKALDECLAEAHEEEEVFCG
jgi:hypothetical protein